MSADSVLIQELIANLIDSRVPWEMGLWAHLWGFMLTSLIEMGRLTSCVNVQSLQGCISLAASWTVSSRMHFCLFSAFWLKMQCDHLLQVSAIWRGSPTRTRCALGLRDHINASLSSYSGHHSYGKRNWDRMDRWRQWDSDPERMLPVLGHLTFGRTVKKIKCGKSLLNKSF